MPGRRYKKPTREARALEAETVEYKIEDAAAHVGLVLCEIDKEHNQQLANAWRQLRLDLETLALRAQKLGC